MVIFVISAVLIFGIFSHFYKPPVPPPQPHTPPAQTSTQSQSGNPSSSSQASAANSNITSAAKIPAIEGSAEKTIVVDSGLYRVELSSRGGVVRSWTLKKYSDDQPKPKPLDLVNSATAAQTGWPFSMVLADGTLESHANQSIYQVTVSPVSTAGDSSKSAASLDGTQFTAPVQVAFQWSDGHLAVTKKFTFQQNYEMSVETSAMLDGAPLQASLAWRGGFGDKAVYKAAQLVTVFYKTNGKLTLLQYKKLGVSGNQSQPATQSGPMEFLGIEDQFFTATFIPDGSDLSLWHWTQNTNIGGDSQPEAEMAAGPSSAMSPVRMRVYVGPKDLALLSKERPSLEELVQFGYMSVIAKPMLFVLQWLHRYIPNFGWAIVVFTLALTMVLLPIRVWTFHSARKMQAVGPEVKAIQEKYKKYSMSDPRKKKMNEEVMELYQREGINPVGSCLPMLVQLPILWGFYRMLSGAIELRHAPWIGWIHDLSAKDPYYILPIAMAISTFLMTKLTPTPAGMDPSQQRMMMVMPLMMAVIFINLSSGLNLYYFTSNLVGVGQQYYLNKTQPPPSRSKFKKKKE
jgi:YidC/Oxa1 family membrane protein insertase